jgi:CubicO group peptidase (beta-lactamase class C family)
LLLNAGPFLPARPTAFPSCPEGFKQIRAKSPRGYPEFSGGKKPWFASKLDLYLSKKGIKVMAFARRSHIFPLIALAVFVFILALGPAGRCAAQRPPFKSRIADPFSSRFPPARGWSAEKLETARRYAQEIGSSAVAVIHDGRLVARWGEVARRMNSHSVRKSLLSALYGIAADRNMIPLDATLQQLGIDDKPPPLSEEEKKATIRDLLKSRSGVYHTAAAETAAMQKRRPERGAHAPGTFWYYNNWDFNVLGAVFEDNTGQKIGRAFKEWIAGPLGMQDFREEDVVYTWNETSQYPAYPFWITARDLARFGVLFLQKGRWDKRQVVPAAWVEESTTPHTRFSSGGFGYMWWTIKEGYYASGWGGQVLMVLPKRKLVVVNQVDTGSAAKWSKLPSGPYPSPADFAGHLVTRRQFLELLDMIMEAAPAGLSHPLSHD